MTLLQLLGVVVRWMLFAAVLVTTGAAAFRFLVLGRMAKSSDDVAQRIEQLSRVAGDAGLLAAVLAIAAAGARLPLQIAELRDETLPLLPQVQALGLQSMWGTVWLYQLTALACAAFAFLAARRGGAGAWRAAAVFAVLAALSLPLSGHAIAVEVYTVPAVIADLLHVLGASAWLGAMVVLAMGLSLESRDDESLREVGGAMVSAFSPMALVAAGLVVLTGVISSWLHLGSITALWQSRYGLTLIVKVGVVMVMAVTGAWNWRKAGPALRESGVVGPMRRSVRVEILIGIFVILATAFLVATPPPGTE